LYDVAIIGLGAMGSATALQLAQRGARVVGFDRERPPHTLGSTHGRSRIIREAYFEHPAYVPLVQRAYQLWAQLERDGGGALFVRTGGVMCGPEHGALVEGTLRSVREHDLPHEVLDASAVRTRFPALAPDDDWIAVFEPRAGILLPEACVGAQIEVARRMGADLHLGETVVSWEAIADGVEIRTAQRRIVAKSLVISAGAWLPQVAPGLPVYLEVERQLMHWFSPARDAALCGPERCPIALWEWEPNRLVATFPDVGDGVKIGVHHEGEMTTPDTVRRTTSLEEDADVRALLARLCPPAAGPQLESRVCLYTNTRDHHFLIDFHPAHPNVLIVSPCSGHGFKFASAIGEVAADLLTGRGSTFDLSLFTMSQERVAAAI
jgi:sarcosine oxidase